MKIPKEELPFIFEPFYRADKSHNRAIGGLVINLVVKNKLRKIF
jgi:signal transduction histidine kinase